MTWLKIHIYIPILSILICLMYFLSNENRWGPWFQIFTQRPPIVTWVHDTCYRLENGVRVKCWRCALECTLSWLAERVPSSPCFPVFFSFPDTADTSAVPPLVFSLPAFFFSSLPFPVPDFDVGRSSDMSLQSRSRRRPSTWNTHTRLFKSSLTPWRGQFGIYFQGSYVIHDPSSNYSSVGAWKASLKSGDV